MSMETPRQETYQTPERVPLFNLDMMDDAQIIVLHRGLVLAGDKGDQESDDFDQMSTGDGMADKVCEDVANLALHDPERVKRLVDTCLASEDKSDIDLGVRSIPGLLHYDFAYTVNTLVPIAYDWHRRLPRDGGSSETAILELDRMMDPDVLRAEQIAEIERLIRVHNPYFGLPTVPETE